MFAHSEFHLQWRKLTGFRTHLNLRPSLFQQPSLFSDENPTLKCVFFYGKLALTGFYNKNILLHFVNIKNL